MREARKAGGTCDARCKVLWQADADRLPDDPWPCVDDIGQVLAWGKPGSLVRLHPEQIAAPAPGGAS